MTLELVPPQKSRARIVKPNLGDALENPVCPNHRRKMRPRVARVFEDGLTYLWWWCPTGDCVTPFVPLPHGAVKNLGPPLTLPGMEVGL